MITGRLPGRFRPDLGSGFAHANEMLHPRLPAGGDLSARSDAPDFLLRHPLMKCCRMSWMPQSHPSQPRCYEVTWLPSNTGSSRCELIFIHSMATCSTWSFAEDGVFQRFRSNAKLLPARRVTQKIPSVSRSIRRLIRRTR